MVMNLQIRTCVSPDEQISIKISGAPPPFIETRFLDKFVFISYKIVVIKWKPLSETKKSGHT